MFTSVSRIDGVGDAHGGATRGAGRFGQHPGRWAAPPSVRSPRDRPLARRRRRRAVGHEGDCRIHRDLGARTIMNADMRRSVHARTTNGRGDPNSECSHDAQPKGATQSRRTAADATSGPHEPYSAFVDRARPSRGARVPTDAPSVEDAFAEVAVAFEPTTPAQLVPGDLDRSACTT
jgi:hypothetical protein